MYTHTCVHMYIHTYTHAYMCVHVYILMYTYMCTLPPGHGYISAHFSSNSTKNKKNQFRRRNPKANKVTSTPLSQPSLTIHSRCEIRSAIPWLEKKPLLLQVCQASCTCQKNFNFFFFFHFFETYIVDFQSKMEDLFYFFWNMSTNVSMAWR